MRIANVLFLFLPTALLGQPICQIQGNGTSSPFVGQVVTTEGIVTAVYTGPGSVNGYFIEQPECDGNSATSNGIFVYDPSPGAISVGQRISMVATVAEFNGTTELINPTWSFLGAGSVTPTPLALPIASLANWERYEGMLLRFPGDLVVSDNTDWVQYGEVTLAPVRPMTPTNQIDPNDADASGTTTNGSSNVSAVTAALDLIGRCKLKLDDGQTTSYPVPRPLADASGTLRTGTVITDLTGVLHYSFGDYKIEPVGPVLVVHDPRPLPPEVGGSIRAAGMNVLNYYTTLGDWGAQNTAELGRQRTKLVAALAALDADVFALCELENSDDAWADLVDALNSSVGAGTYSAIEEDGFGGGTRTVILYKPAALTPITPLYWLGTGLFQRPHLTQGFVVNANGGRFLFSTMHLRSKLCDNAEGDDLDQADGQGCYNALRRSQTAALVEHWAGLRSTTGIDAHLVLGDYNAYNEEDPLDLLRANGLVDLLEGADHTHAYQGTFGALDHAFATGSMAQVITGAEPWHINADEPVEFNYRDANISRYQPNAFRSSDHDPVLVGFDSDALSVGLAERSPGSDIRCWQIQGQANWFIPAEFGGPCRLQLFASSGALVHDEMAQPGMLTTIDQGGLAVGLLAWRVVSMEGGTVGVGRLLVP